MRGVKGFPLRNQKLFENFFIVKKIPTAIELEGEGGKALMAMPLSKDFFSASLKEDAHKKSQFFSFDEKKCFSA